MSDVDNQEVESNPINDFIDAIADGNFNASEDIFNNLVQGKVSDALDAEKVAVAADIFNGGRDEELEIEIEEEDIDEEIEEE